jgi:hypothetical protein
VDKANCSKTSRYKTEKAGLGPVAVRGVTQMLTQSMAVSALPLLMTCWPNSAPFEGEKAV